MDSLEIATIVATIAAVISTLDTVVPHLYRSLKGQDIRGIVAKPIIRTIIDFLILAALVYVIILLQSPREPTIAGSLTPSPALAPTFTPGPIPARCPQPDQVAVAMGIPTDNLEQVTITHEDCMFTYHAASNVHCAIGYGSSSIDEKNEIFACTGNDAHPISASSGTIRFVKWESDGDACNVALKRHNTGESIKVLNFPSTCVGSDGQNLSVSTQ